MIYDINNEEDALKVLKDIVNDFTAAHTLVWDLHIMLCLDDIPISVYQCRACDAVEYYHAGEPVHSACPYCGKETMELAAEVDMIVRDEKVLYRKGDQ